ncbi:MAG: radical SAM protein [Candidatus Abyssobacteria bacterium SURF_17]|uniref:Radical SAM protein n=1 Tax=Candidatus Abyssobacteria bacterium SURF_17 TaxID=2093361 RepID=A0A419F2N5_9BACT|nr:MAG: radical SAM protein [Candidatus Abyssubacteria bacterium SURF_17]
MRISLLSIQSRYSGLPNLGLLSIAAVLEQAGHNVQVLDPKPGHEREAVKAAAEYDPRIVGLSFMTAGYSNARNAVLELRRILPRALLCCGGPHTTALPEQTLKDFGADFVVIGEGELTMLEVCNRLERKASIDDVAGLGIMRDERFVRNRARELIRDLDSLPLPARHLVHFEKFLQPPGMLRGYLMGRCATIMASRGCPHECIYCASKVMFGRTVRQRSVENVIAEVDHLVEQYRILGLWFPDDTFTLNRRWVLEFCVALRERHPQLVWGAQARVNSVDHELLHEMRRAGCVQLDFGVESGSQEVLAALKKKARPAQAIEAFALCRKVGIRPLATFMIGNPGEGREEIKESMKLAKRLHANHVQFCIATPLPGTELLEMAIRNNWLDGPLDFSRDWDVRKSRQPVMAIHFSPHELLRIQARLQNRFLLPNYAGYLKDARFLWKLLSSVARYPDVFAGGIALFLRTGKLNALVEGVFQSYEHAVWEGSHASGD